MQIFLLFRTVPKLFNFARTEQKIMFLYDITAIGYFSGRTWHVPTTKKFDSLSESYDRSDRGNRSFFCWPPEHWNCLYFHSTILYCSYCSNYNSIYKMSRWAVLSQRLKEISSAINCIITGQYNSRTTVEAHVHNFMLSKLPRAFLKVHTFDTTMIVFT